MKNKSKKKQKKKTKNAVWVASAIAMIFGAALTVYGLSLNRIAICNCPMELPGQVPCKCISPVGNAVGLLVAIGIMSILVGIWWAVLNYYKHSIVHPSRRA